MSAKALTIVDKQQTRRTSLRADFSWMFVGNAVYAGGQFVILMLMAKLVRPEMVGQYALGLAVVYPVMMFTNLQLRAIIASDIRQQTPFGIYLGLRLLTTSLGLLLVFLITQILGYDHQLTTVVLLVGLAYAIETISDVYYGRLQLHDRMVEISKSLMARALLSVLGLALAIYVTRSVLWGVAGVVLGRAIILFGYDMCERTHGLRAQSKWFSRSEVLVPRLNCEAQRKLLCLSLPLGIVTLLGCLNSSIPNFFIKSALGERDVAIFAAVGFLVSVGNMAVISLGQSAFTRLAECYASGNLAGFASLLGKLLVFGAAIGVGGMVIAKLAGRELLTILFRPEYAQQADLLPWIMAAGGVLFMGQFLGFGMTAANFYHSQVAVNILANLSLLGACCWLVPRQALFGAVLAMLIGAIVRLVGSIVVLARGVRMQGDLSAERVSAA